MRLFRYLKLFIDLFKLRLSQQMIYSLNFWVGVFVDIIVFFIQLIVFETIYTQVDLVNGWSKYHMSFYLGTFMIVDSLSMFSYYMGVIGIPHMVKGGLLDMYILKPVSTLFFISFKNVNAGSLFIAVPGISLVVYSVKKLDISVTFGKVTGYVFLVLLMLLLLYDIMLIVRTFSFWVVSINSLEGLETEMENFSYRIPGIALKGIAKVVFYVFIPYGLIATIPTQFFTQQISLQMWGYIIFICFVFTMVSMLFWKFGLKYYTSVNG